MSNSARNSGFVSDHLLRRNPARVMLAILTVAALAWTIGVHAEQSRVLRWNECLAQQPGWYVSSEAIRIADNVLLYQRAIGGWPKNINVPAPLSDRDKAAIARKKTLNDDCTIDNGATYTQMIFLARVFNATGDSRFKAAFLKGLDFLLEIQFVNGGWPQFPYRSGYYRHITFNDYAMVNVMTLLRDIARKQPDYAFVGAARRARAKAAVRKGVDCILKCQVIANSKRTVWCAQHDEHSLQPMPARSYELVSLSGAESVGIVQFLMRLDDPSQDVIDSVQAAIEWFEQVKITGVRIDKRPDPALPKGYDKVVVEDSAAPPIWARFYDIDDNRPFFCGRDGVKKYKLCEIEHERRVGYSWHTSAPAQLLESNYPAWLARLKSKTGPDKRLRPAVDVPTQE